MSEMLKSLVGERCSIRTEDAEYLTGSADIACEVLDVDGEWIKIAYHDRTGRSVTRMDRVETLESITVYKE